MKASERRIRRKLLSNVALAAVVAVLLSACQTNQGPATEEHSSEDETAITAAGITLDESLRVRFQEPVGSATPVSGTLSLDLNLEIAIFALDQTTGKAFDEALPPELSTRSGTISETAGSYSAAWNVGETAPKVPGGYVRVEIRPAGVPLQPVCNDPWGACLGYFDARIVATGGSTKTPPSADNYLNVADHSTVPITFKVLAGTAEPPATVNALLSMAGNGDEFSKQGNCSSTDFQGLQAVGAGLQAVGAGLQAVGAGLQAVGAVGGLFVADPAKVTGRVTTNDAVAAQLLAGMGQAEAKYYAALLVVDEFNGVFELPQRLLDGNDLMDGEFDKLLELEEGALSHGALVLHQIKQLAAAATGDNKARTSGTDTEYKAARGTRLLVRAVDAHDLDTDRLAGVIRDAIESLSDDYRRVVVNMSFAIVPCAVDSDVEGVVGTGSIATFEEYVASLLEINAIAPEYLDEVGKLASLPVPLAEDEFLEYLDCPLETDVSGAVRCDGDGPKDLPLVDSLIHLAASGNFGNDYALFPAALPSVVSVDSLDAEGAGYSAIRSSFSNAATVLAPGALMQLATKDTQQIVYAGTSFAAPIVSLFAALDQMAKAPQCDAGDLSTLPVVKYHDMAGDALDDLPLLSTFTDGSVDALGELCN